ncbi:MAG: type IV secretory system conjugative DNA transfer family protein, partial [Acidimicrobiales bacterium]
TREAIWHPADLLAGGSNTLYLLSGGQNAERLAPIYSCLVSEVVEAAIASAKASPSGRLEPGLRMVLDELATTAPFPGLPDLLATGAGLGIHLLCIFQSLSQIDGRWGKEARATILGNCAASLWARSDDPETMDHLSKVLGSQQVAQHSVSVDDGRRRRSRSTSLGSRSTLDASGFRTSARPILLAQGIPPAPLDWRYYDRDRRLSRLAGLPKPTLRADQM